MTYSTAHAVRSRALPPWPPARPLRAWQRAAAEAVLAHPGDSFLASATPAAGKTTFGLHVAHRMLSEGRVGRVAVVAPTTHICRQWAADYTEALVDGVCRPVTFHTYDGDMAWVSDGRRRRADFTVGLPAAEAARRLRTALDPEGDWVGHVLRDAHRELVDLRAGDHPDAGGLVIAIDMEHAERLAGRLARVAGERPEIVTSDAADASARIARFAAGSGSWL